MRGRMRIAVTVLCVLGSATGLSAQATAGDVLFQSEEPLELTLEADFELLRGDRRGEAPERPAMVRLVDANGVEHEIEAQLRTRGRFRRDAANCTYPPLRLNLKKKQTEGTEFEGQDKLKVVGSCRPNRESYDQLVLLEYLAYRSYERVSTMAFRTRLARITYVDSNGASDPFTRFAFFIEDDDALGDRFGATVFQMEEGKNLPPGFLDAPTAATAAVFAYMIGNTDWSDVAGHNVELLDLAGIALPVPYDFDFSGIVNAPYAIPDPSLGIKDVRERYYRGWCFKMDMTDTVQRFADAEEDILSLWRDLPWLDDGQKNRAVRYLEVFFEEVQSIERAERRFLRDCRAMPG